MVPAARDGGEDRLGLLLVLSFLRIGWWEEKPGMFFSLLQLGSKENGETEGWILRKKRVNRRTGLDRVSG